MVREVELVSYLPEFLAEYKEISAALETENPEFILVWNATDRTLRNEFIETADEYGISRFEKILNILPSKEDTLESRRARVYSRWFNSIPCTLKAFIAKLISICGKSNFSIVKDYLNYNIKIAVGLEMFGQIEELERIIETMIPCNMTVNSVNKIQCVSEGKSLIGSGIGISEIIVIRN